METAFKRIKIGELAERIRTGCTREQLREELGMNPTDYKTFCNHPKIKGLKTGIGASIIFEDDEIEVDYKDHPGAAYPHVHAQTEVTEKD